MQNRVMTSRVVPYLEPKQRVKPNPAAGRGWGWGTGNRIPGCGGGAACTPQQSRLTPRLGTQAEWEQPTCPIYCLGPPKRLEGQDLDRVSLCFHWSRELYFVGPALAIVTELQSGSGRLQARVHSEASVGSTTRSSRRIAHILLEVTFICPSSLCV